MCMQQLHMHIIQVDKAIYALCTLIYACARAHAALDAQYSCEVTCLSFKIKNAHMYNSTSWVLNTLKEFSALLSHEVQE